MAKSDLFFENLVGIHDIRVNGGSLLPRRTTINVVGGRAEDVNGTTQFSVGITPVWAATAVVSSNLDDATFTGFDGATDMPLDPTGSTRSISGFDSGSLTVFRKRIWNFSGGSIDLELLHNDSGSAAANRILTPDGLTMTVAAGEVATIQRTANNLNWRAHKCLI